MNKHLISLRVLVLAGTFMLTVSGHAQWTGGAGNNSYWDAGNWVSGSVNHQFIGSDANGGYGWTANYGLNPGNNAVFTTDSLVYRNTDNFDFALQVVNASGLTLNGPGQTFTFSVDIGGTFSKNFTLGGHAGWGSALNASGKNLVFDISPSYANSYQAYQGNGSDTFNFYVTGTNIGNLTKKGAGTLMFNGIDQFRMYVTGSVSVEDGILWLGTGNQALTGPRIVGATNYTVSNRAALLLDSYSSNAATQNLIETSSTVNLRDGALAAREQASGAAGPFNQSVGAVHLRTGLSAIGITGNAQNTATPSVLTLGSLTRHNFATVSITDNNFSGYSTFIRVTDDSNILAALVGGTISNAVLDAGSAGSVGTGITNLKILPWAAGKNGTYYNYQGGWQNGADPYNANTMVTYSATTGLRVLRDNEFYQTNVDAGSKTLMAAAADDNVWLRRKDNANDAVYNLVSASKTINSMRLSDWDVHIHFQNSSTLTVASGLILVGGGGRIDIGNGTDNKGYVTAGDRELIIAGGGGATFNVPIINTIDPADRQQAGVIINSANLVNGRTVFTVANTYGGATIVQGGLEVRHAWALPVTTDLRLDAFGDLLINYSGNLTSRLRVNELTGSGKINFDKTTTGNLTVGDLASDVSLDPADVYIPRTVIVNHGFHLSPGDNNDIKTGTLLLGDQVAGVTFNAGAFFDVDLTAGGLSDRLSSLNPAAELTFSDSAIVRLNLLDGLAAAEGDSWVLGTGFDTINLGDYLLQDAGANDLSNLFELSISGNNLLLTAIPEPSAWALLSVSGVALLLTPRRRR